MAVPAMMRFILMVASFIGGASYSLLTFTDANPTPPLQVCQGDCDNDNHCPGYSKCVQRDNGEPATVQGCAAADASVTDQGTGADQPRKDTDYCSNPSPASIQKCHEGQDDIAGDHKMVMVQICNLFGATCYVNQIKSTDCSKALKVENRQCKLFPVANIDSNTVGAITGCSFTTNGDLTTASGNCVSVQCDLGSNNWAGPASIVKTDGVTDTSLTSAFKEHQFASIPSNARALKAVFLTRVGAHVGTSGEDGDYNGAAVDGEGFYSWGDLPTSTGNDYGPKSCPASNTLVSAVDMSKEDIRMCGGTSGGTGEWIYFGAVNLYADRTYYMKYSSNSATGVGATMKSVGAMDFLKGESGYESSANMDDQRQVYLMSASADTTALFTSEIITPAVQSDTNTNTGAWRFYAVVFYCDDYARTDLTACTEANRKMFYVGDPSPGATYGTSVASLGGSNQVEVNGASSRVAMYAFVMSLVVFARM